MKIFTTLSDSHYMDKGIAMYNSLLETSSEDFVLHYLCLDQKCYDIFTKLKVRYKKFDKMIIDNLSTIEKQSSWVDFQEHKKQFPSKDLESYMDYCFVLASYYTNYLYNNMPPTDITYLDSDLYFYKDINLLYKEIGNKSIGIIPHRHISLTDYYGLYNVSFVYFKNNKIAKDVLYWWKDAVLTRKYPELHTCGDQKYLDEFIPRFGEENICVINKNSYGAPWNYRLYVYDQLEKNGNIIYGNESQPLVFNHFSKFVCDYDNNRYIPDNGTYNGFTCDQRIYNIPQLKKLHDNYFEILKGINKVIKNV